MLFFLLSACLIHPPTQEGFRKLLSYSRSVSIFLFHFAQSKLTSEHAVGMVSKASESCVPFVRDRSVLKDWERSLIMIGEIGGNESNHAFFHGKVSTRSYNIYVKDIVNAIINMWLDLELFGLWCQF